MHAHPTPYVLCVVCCCPSCTKTKRNGCERTVGGRRRRSQLQQVHEKLFHLLAQCLASQHFQVHMYTRVCTCTYDDALLPAVYCTVVGGCLSVGYGKVSAVSSSYVLLLLCASKVGPTWWATIAGYKLTRARSVG